MKLEKERYELQEYSRRNNVEILGLPDIFTGDLLTEKAVELCNYVIDFFKKKVTISYPKKLVRFVNR